MFRFMGSKKKNSFLSRLLLTYLVAALIPLFCIIGILFHLKWDAGKQEMQRTADYTAELLSIQLESVWNTMSFISLDIVSHGEFVAAAVGLTYENTSSYEKSRCYNTLVGAISAYPYVSSSYRVVFFNEEGYFMTNERYNRAYDYTYRLPEGCLEQYGWIGTARNNYGKEIMLPVSSEALPNTATEGFSLVRSVRDPGSVVGFLAVQLTGDSLTQLLCVGELYDIDIMISRGSDIIYRSEGFPAYAAESLGEDRGALLPALRQNYLVSSVLREDSDIQVTAVISMETVLRQMRADFMLIGLIAVFVTLLTLIMIYVFARRMSAPLILFTKKMKDTTVRNLLEDSDDRSKAPFHEVQLLYDEFSRMRGRLEVMIENEIALTALQSKERLRYLQSQINPHFLYNTFECIRGMALYHGKEDIAEITMALSNVFRFAIKGNDIVSVEEEVNHILEYATIIEYRFMGKISIDVTADETVRKKKVFKLMLQPLVENAVFHGLEQKMTDGLVDVTITSPDDSHLCFVVEDDGCGIAPYKLKDILNQLDDYENTSKVGLFNIYQRLKLFYEDQFTFRIDSEQGKGTRITILIPDDISEITHTGGDEHDRLYRG